MTEQELDKNIKLVDFDFDNQEMTAVRKIVGSYSKKIKNYTEYEQLKIEIRTHNKEKIKKYEIKISLTYGGNRAFCEETGLNPLILLNDALEKIVHEVQHKLRK